MEQVRNNFNEDTIAAISTPPGVGGIAVVRVSGPEAISIVNSAWKGADLIKAKSHSVHYGQYINIEGQILDEGVATIFINPASFTGENVVEIGIHGSAWIQREILADLIKRGARIADPGEFTQRAFFNGRIDLAQAEGIADLISSSSKAAHDMAINQIRGEFSKEFNHLRNQLIEFASLLELELDFSEEDVEFADRSKLIELLDMIIAKVDKLAKSYSVGAVLKNGVPVVIAGVPNAGKSSLLNLILGDEKAIVTDIPGTTRDLIEDALEINGILFRFIDTAGIRKTEDTVESIGVYRALDVMKKASIIIWVFDSTSDLSSQGKELKEFMASNPSVPVIALLNKTDLTTQTPVNQTNIATDNTGNETHLQTEALPNITDIASKTKEDKDKQQIIEAIINTSEIKSDSTGEFTDPDILKNQATLTLIPFSTKTSKGLNELLQKLTDISQSDSNPNTDVIVTNARHYEALTKALQSLIRARNTIDISADLVAQDIREATTHLSTITGSITSTDLLQSIFSRFCIGK